MKLFVKDLYAQRIHDAEEKRTGMCQHPHILAELNEDHDVPAVLKCKVCGKVL